MKPRPSPTFCPEMRAAILAGRKTMTRRVMIPQPTRQASDWSMDLEPGDVYIDVFRRVWRTAESHGRNARDAGELSKREIVGRYGGPGDVWYLREPLKRADKGMVVYLDDGCPVMVDEESRAWTWKRPTLAAMYMPAWAARHFLRVTAVPVERLQDITEADVRAEGIESNGANPLKQLRDFALLWDRLNAERKHPWSANDWVWCYNFERTEAPK